MNIIRDSRNVPSLRYSLWFAALGFCLASLLVFATVAFAERWMYRHLGFYGAYATWIVLFIVLGGSVLSPLVTVRQRWPWFHMIFGATFLAYAVAWMGAYFTIRGTAGEWIGSLAGSVLMGLILAAAFGASRAAPRLITVLFIANAAGYFLGAALFYSIQGKIGMLLFGVVYGLSLGAGFGAALCLAQASGSQKVAEAGLR
jgi:hypothetical protein